MLCEVGESDTALVDYESALVRDIICEYGMTINYQSQKFEFVTRLAAAFEAYAAQNSRGRLDKTRRMFIDERWADYIEELGLDAVPDDLVKEIVARLILEKVLYRQRVIKAVKEGMNLAD